MPEPDLEVATDGVRAMAGQLSKVSDDLLSATRPDVPDAGASSGELTDAFDALVSGLNEVAAALDALASKTAEQADEFDRVDERLASSLIVQSDALPGDDDG